MRAPLSIIIPTLNAEAGLPETLASLTEGLRAGIIREVVVSDGGSTDGTLRVADAAGAVVVTGAPGRGGQLRRGVTASGGDWLLVLHADTVLEPGWCDVVQEAMAQARAGYGTLRFRADGFAPRFVAGWANLRSRVLGLPYGDQGLLVSRAAYGAAGGYPDIPLMEDVALARALRGQLSPLGFIAQTGAERYLQGGWVRRGWRNLVTLVRYLLGADPEVLAQAYRRR
ncbi:TIGR04283 family arsenosugar biosynthesis glycosyltransferase [Cognatishimia sp. MH4019]|uniref:TIGR04283 family arsenosugar biosynthesis glycosyltransferase n=1 Tax=Cognatishimia sp. MH4019 TaxID=2854030 RepID=UPI001CD30F47|nr:TIGR04283 family arsenosugar biosynthesis glycosyltransferase [Cognatishimia sp. MH4019]